MGHLSTRCSSSVIHNDFMLLEGEEKFIEGDTSGKSGREAALGAESKKGNRL